MGGWIVSIATRCHSQIRSETPACTIATHPSIHPSTYHPLSIYPTIANLKQALLHAARLVDLRTSRQRGERGPPHHLSKAAGAAWVASGGAGRQGAARGGEGRRGAVRGGEGR
jgi:hypothetical protein